MLIPVTILLQSMGRCLELFHCEFEYAQHLYFFWIRRTAGFPHYFSVSDFLTPFCKKTIWLLKTTIQLLVKNESEVTLMSI